MADVDDAHNNGWAAYKPSKELLAKWSEWHDERKNNKPVKTMETSLYAISDTLPGGVNGMLNHINGKKYDSKSAYYKDLKASGHHIFEGTPNPNKVLNKGDHNVFKELKDAAHKHGVL